MSEVMNEMQTITPESESKLDEQERAMAFEVEQRAALYGLCVGLLNMSNTKSKKYIKRFRKLLRTDVIKELGSKPAEEILSRNADGVIDAITRIRNTQSLDKQQRRKLMRVTADQWGRSLEVGFSQLYGQ